MLGRNNVRGVRGSILCRQRRDCAHFRGNSRNGSAISGWWPASTVEQREKSNP